MGKYPYVGLKEARELHLAMRQQLAHGQDPKLVREAEQKASVSTFGAVAAEWLKINQSKAGQEHPALAGGQVTGHHHTPGHPEAGRGQGSL